jgi:hypothetical protein
MQAGHLSLVTSHELLSFYYVSIEYSTFVDTDQKRRPTFCQSKIPQAAVDVKWVHEMFDRWAHESSSNCLRFEERCTLGASRRTGTRGKKTNKAKGVRQNSRPKSVPRDRDLRSKKLTERKAQGLRQKIRIKGPVYLRPFILSTVVLRLLEELLPSSRSYTKQAGA